jgi:hypothetical protein
MSTTLLAMESLIGHHVTGWRHTEWRRLRGSFDGILEAVERSDPQCPCRIRADDGSGVTRSHLAAMYTQPPELLEWLAHTQGLSVLEPDKDLRRSRSDDPWFKDVIDRHGVPITGV